MLECATNSDARSSRPATLTSTRSSKAREDADRAGADACWPVRARLPILDIADVRLGNLTPGGDGPSA
jgi:hypothetical protein